MIVNNSTMWYNLLKGYHIPNEMDGRVWLETKRKHGTVWRDV